MSNRWEAVLYVKLLVSALAVTCSARDPSHVLYAIALLLVCDDAPNHSNIPLLRPPPTCVPSTPSTYLNSSTTRPQRTTTKPLHRLRRTLHPADAESRVSSKVSAPRGQPRTLSQRPPHSQQRGAAALHTLAQYPPERHTLSAQPTTMQQDRSVSRCLGTRKRGPRGQARDRQ